jgi:hypothetical protein
MPYLLIKTTLVAVILGLFASFAQAEATPRFPLNEVTTPATPVGYGHGYGGYGRGYGRYGGGYSRWYGGYGGGYGRGYSGYGGGYGRGYGGYGGGYGCGRDYY